MPKHLPYSLALPGTLTDHERLHCLKGAQHGRDVGAAATFSPTDHAVVSGGFHDDVRYTVTVDQGTDFSMCIRDADGSKL